MARQNLERPLDEAFLAEVGKYYDLPREALASQEGLGGGERFLKGNALAAWANAMAKEVVSRLMGAA